MPGRDKTGPQGDGPMTGRRMGNCADNENQPGTFFGRGGRFGMGRGNRRGYGMGRRGNFDADVSNESEKSLLADEIGMLKNQLSSLAKEVMGLKKKGVE